MQTRSQWSQQYEDWPSSILVNNCLTCEHMEIIRKSILATDTCLYSHLCGRALHPPHERGIRGNKLRKRDGKDNRRSGSSRPSTSQKSS